MKKLTLSCFFASLLLCFLLSACGDGGEWMDKQANENQATPLWGETGALVKPSMAITPEILEVYRACGPAMIKCNKPFMDSLDIMRELAKKPQALESTDSTENTTVTAPSNLQTIMMIKPLKVQD